MTAQIYKTKGEKGLFDEQFTIERLSEIGNPLEMISNVIDFERFRSTALKIFSINTNEF